MSGQILPSLQEENTDSEFILSERQDSCKSIPTQIGADKAKKINNVSGVVKRMRPASASILAQKSKKLLNERHSNKKYLNRDPSSELRI